MDRWQFIISISWKIAPIATLNSIPILPPMIPIEDFRVWSSSSLGEGGGQREREQWKWWWRRKLCRQLAMVSKVPRQLSSRDGSPVESLEHAYSATCASDCCLPSASCIKKTRYNAVSSVRDDSNRVDEIINHDQDDENGGCNVYGDDLGIGNVNYYCKDSVSSVKSNSDASDVSNEVSNGWQSQPLLEWLSVYSATLQGRQWWQWQ